MNSSNAQSADDLFANAALMGSTNDVIRWDALKERIARSPPAIDADERCRLFLKVVNGERLRPTHWNQLVGATILNAPDTVAIPLPNAERESFGRVLERLVKDRTDRREKQHAEARRHKPAKEDARRVNVANVARVVSDSVVIVPDLRFGGSRIVASTVLAALYYALWLLADPNGPFRPLLCRCEWSKCHRFYMLEAGPRGPGAPQRAYCSPEHRMAGNSEKTANKAKKRRAEAT